MENPGEILNEKIFSKFPAEAKRFASALSGRLEVSSSIHPDVNSDLNVGGSRGADMSPIQNIGVRGTSTLNYVGLFL